MLCFFILKYISFEVDYRQRKNVIFRQTKGLLSLAVDLRGNYVSQLSIIALNHDLEILKNNLNPG